MNSCSALWPSTRSPAKVRLEDFVVGNVVGVCVSIFHVLTPTTQRIDSQSYGCRDTKSSAMGAAILFWSGRERMVRGGG